MFGLGSNHRRCESIESLLRGQVNDLIEQNVRLLERLEEQSRAHSARESELMDRYMAAVNPAALRELTAANRAATPAAPMPSMIRMPMSETPGVRVGGTNPRLTPTQTGFGGRVAGAGSAQAQTIPAAAVPAED